MIVGSIVVPGAAVLGPARGFAVIHEQRPIFGRVTALTPGTPPTDVTVVWNDGTQVEYAAVNETTASVIWVLADSEATYITGSIVQPTVASGVPNPGGRLRGMVVQQFVLEDPSGTPSTDVVVVETPLGFLIIAVADVEVVPSA